MGSAQRVPTTHLQYLQEANLYESAAEAENREHVLGQLDRIVKDWVKAVHAAEGYAQSLCEEVNGKIFTFGSYRLGVHGPGEVGSCQAHSDAHPYDHESHSQCSPCVCWQVLISTRCVWAQGLCGGTSTSLAPSRTAWSGF